MYVFVKDRDFTLKNNLQKEMFSYLQQNHRRTFRDKSEAKEFLSEIKTKMEDLNIQHKRCIPLRLDSWAAMEKSDFIVCIGGLIYYRFYYGRDPE